MAPFDLRSDGRNDRGSIIVTWLIKVGLVLTVVAVAAFDALSITSTTASLNDEGAFAARAAATAWEEEKNVQRAFDAAVTAAATKNEKDKVVAKDFRIDPDGTVHLTIKRPAKTFVVYRIKPIAHWAKITQTVSGRPAV